MSRCPETLRVGDVLMGGSFVITPADVATDHAARLLAERIEHPGGPGVSAGPPPAAGGLRPELLVSGALGRLRAHALADLHPTFERPGRLALLAAPVIGEPIACVATVRFRSKSAGGIFVTLRVELRRRRGGTLASFDVGAQLADEAAESEDPPLVSPFAA
jgi:hypothetical protein